MAATADAITTRTDSTVKLFQLTQKYYHIIGIFPSQLQPNHRFNWKNVLILFVCVASFISIFCSLIFLFFETNSMEELASTFYSQTALLTAILYYLLNIFQRDHIYRMIEYFEEFIGKRKL